MSADFLLFFLLLPLPLSVHAKDLVMLSANPARLSGWSGLSGLSGLPGFSGWFLAPVSKTDQIDQINEIDQFRLSLRPRPAN